MTCLFWGPFKTWRILAELKQTIVEHIESVEKKRNFRRSTVRFKAFKKSCTDFKLLSLFINKTFSRYTLKER